ncbi:MAG: hypothetical protein M3Q99_07305 [Acidobacteriota bacterium]|nr:hypothetical protein [Acidobacteriota bacterium]
MKKTLVQQIEQNGVVFGQVSSPADIVKAQDFIHQRVSDLTHDFLNSSKANEVIGFAYELGGGNSFQFTVKTPGRIYTQNGKEFDLPADTTVTIQPADAELPRLDLVVAVLEENMDAALALIPFVRLRTIDEFSANATPYPPQNINAPREKHDRAVVQIKTGTPATVPALPTLNSNEVPLYLIVVAPTAAQIRDADVSDLRDIILTLRRINEVVLQNRLDINSLLLRIEGIESLASQPIDLSHIFGQIRTLGEILADHERQLNAIRDLPEARFERPKFPLTHPDSGKIPAVGNLVGAVPTVDIDIGGYMSFTGSNVPLTPDKFVDPALNARFAQSAASNPGNVQTSTNLTLNTVTQLATDGSTDFTEKASSFDTLRSRPASAARNSQLIEVFGGLALDNSTALGDWLTYDTINDTLTPRTPLTALPTADRPAMFSYGDGIHVLLICGKSTTTNPQIFKLNCVTGGVTEILTAKPTGVQFFGDLIVAGKIFIVAIQPGTDGAAQFWEFDTTGNTFVQVGTTGSIPKLYLDLAGGCHLKNGQFLLLRFAPRPETNSAKTYYFTRSDATWREYNIHNPNPGENNPFSDTGDPFGRSSALSRFDMANVNGKPIVVGGNWTDMTGRSLIWEFTGSKWKYTTGTHPTYQDFGFASTLGVVSSQAQSLPYGGGTIFTGRDVYGIGSGKIYSSIQSGLSATIFKGSPAITIADNSTFVEFTIPVYAVPFDVSGYLLTLTGQFDSSNLKIEVSFDNQNYHQVKADEFLTVGDSANPGVRSIRFTFYNFKTTKPILSKISEVFDEDGEELESRIIIRYDAPQTVQALYIDRFGNITLSPIIEPSDTTKALLHKVTPVTNAAPTVKNYINRRPSRIKYTKAKSAGVTVANELATPARYVDARAVKAADNHLYKIPDPAVAFDGIITVTDVADGDTWIVELEG